MIPCSSVFSTKATLINTTTNHFAEQYCKQIFMTVVGFSLPLPYFNMK